MEEIDPNYTLITGFCVDAENQPHFQNNTLIGTSINKKYRIYGNAANQVLRSESDDDADI